MGGGGAAGNAPGRASTEKRNQETCGRACVCVRVCRCGRVVGDRLWEVGFEVGRIARNAHERSHPRLAQSEDTPPSFAFPQTSVEEMSVGTLPAQLCAVTAREGDQGNREGRAASASLPRKSRLTVLRGPHSTALFLSSLARCCPSYRRRITCTRWRARRVGEPKRNGNLAPWQAATAAAASLRGRVQPRPRAGGGGARRACCSSSQVAGSVVVCVCLAGCARVGEA